MVRFDRRVLGKALVGGLGAYSLAFLPGAAEPDDEGEEPSQGERWSRWNAAHGDPYELDRVERWLKERERPSCNQGSMVAYRGTTIRYSGSVLVNPVFRERLERFETLAAALAREVYGREPHRLKHYGAYNCRVVRTIRTLVSEHALGNALDVVGFDFGPATKATPLPPDVPRALRFAFEVRVLRHWGKTDGPSAIHGRFLTTLTERLRERGDVFRSMFGPGHVGHEDHLHFDVSPWRYVDL
jgi:hypothetical protein